MSQPEDQDPDRLFAIAVAHLDDVDTSAPGEPSDDTAWDAILTLQRTGSRAVLDLCAARCVSPDPLERRVAAAVLGQLGVGDRRASTVFREERFQALHALLVAEIWSRSDNTSLCRHGLYDTAEAAKREARAVIGWLRGDLAASASVAVPWSEALDWRPLEPRERAVLDWLLTAEFPGRDRVAAQARTALVRQIDDVGSLRFRVGGTPAVVAGRVPVEGSYQDGDDTSGPRINLLLHIVGGRLHELEVFKDDGTPIRVGPFEVSLDRITIWPD